MDDPKGAALWAARMLLMFAGGQLAARGIGDAAVWGEVTGALIAGGGALWSWRARRARTP